MRRFRERPVSITVSPERGAARPWWRSHRSAIALLVIAAYVPVLLSAPGEIPGDTKLYLYLDPWRLISDSVWTWDNRQLGGWVPHQNVGYLWPTGPWFAGFDALGVADWVAHRLWLGTMLLSAGLGTLWLARRLGLGIGSALLAALAYQLSPFVLPYISRTSALLLPWALLPWMCGLVIAIALHRRWWHVFIFAGLVLSSGGLNATALLMIAPGPLVWLIHLWRSGRVSTRRFLGVTGGLGLVSVAVSGWWLIGLSIQGRYGAAVLSYSEALASTAATSSAPEVLRGLGYWLFYDRNDVVSLTSAATPYQGHLVVMAAGGILVLLGLWGMSGHHRWRWPLLTSVLVGTVLAVGAHPFGDPSPLWSFAADNPRHALSLALRSSSRAAPVVILALAIGIGLAVERVFTVGARFQGKSTGPRVLVISGVMVLIGVNLPALFGGRLIDPVMTRPNDLPAAWIEAADFLDQRFDQGYTGSVLLVPGIESAAYRWGYPVDPILPGLTKKPVISRDWLPLGSAPLMDLVYALDDSFQSGTARAESVAPIARLLGADTVMVVNSHQYERFRTIRPERNRHLFINDPPGLSSLATFGAEVFNQAPELDPENRSWSEELVAYPYLALPEIELFAVIDPTPRARLTTAPGVVAGDGAGLVDLASAALIDGKQILIAEAALDDDELQQSVNRAPEIFVTDSNRRRAHHWRSSQNVWGATEPETGVLLVEDLFDARLPVFPRGSAISQTVVAPAAVTARATSYGPELSFHPEHRPTMAIDGNPDTAWRVGTHRNPVGEILEITTTAAPITRLRLVQPLDHNPLRWITAIEYRYDSAPWIPLSVGEASRTASGQIISLPQPASTVFIRITAINWTDPASHERGPGVGFAEVIDQQQTSTELIVVPRRIQMFAGPSTATSYLFSRWRRDPFERWRNDPEPTLERQFNTAHPFDFIPAVSARLHWGASDSLLLQTLNLGNGQIDVSAPMIGAHNRLQGSAKWWGLAALDGNPATVWWTASPLDITVKSPPKLAIPLTRVLTSMTIQQVNGPTASRVTNITIESVLNGVVQESLDLLVPGPDSQGRSQVSVPALRGDQLLLTISDIDATTVRDEKSGLLTTAPVGIIDITADGWSNFLVPERFDTGCRSDLFTINGEPVALRLTGLVTSALAGEHIQAEMCNSTPLRLPAGDHLISSTQGSLSGWDIDTVLLRDIRRSPLLEAQPVSIQIDRGHRTVTGVDCVSSCWIEGPDGWNTGWSAALDGQGLASPRASAGGRSMWFVEESNDAADGPTTLTMTWTPQRAMWWALGISFFTPVALGVLAWRQHRRHLNTVGDLPSPSSTFLAGDLFSSKSTSLQPASIWGVVILGALVIAPLWGVAGAGVVLFLRRRRRLLTCFGWSLVALGFAFLLAQQVRTGVEPGFGWPSVFARAHRPTLLGLVLLWVAANERRSREPLGASR